MKILMPVARSATKTTLVSHLRHLVISDVVAKALRYQGHEVEIHSYVDDTSSQIARVSMILPQGDLPETNIAQFLGQLYVEANLSISASDARLTKSILENNAPLRGLIQKALDEESAFLKVLNIDVGRFYWESEGLKNKVALLEKLQTRQRLLSYEKYGGGSFIDYTDKSLKLMELYKNGTSTFLFKTLLFLHEQAAGYGTVVACHSDKSQLIFDMAQRFLEDEGIPLERITTARVVAGGQALSTKQGGWENYTIRALLGKFKDATACDLSLGLRLYYLSFSDTSKLEFSFEELERFVQTAHKANQLLLKISTDQQTLENVARSETQNLVAGYLRQKLPKNYKAVKSAFFNSVNRLKRDLRDGYFDEHLFNFARDMVHILGGNPDICN